MTDRILILGAAGRDFHVFNTVYRGDDSVRVVGFTAQQIPHIDDRSYPAELAGPLYPDGIPIFPESELEQVIESEGVTRCVMAYSDVSHEYVMHLASRVNALGPDFRVGFHQAGCRRVRQPHRSGQEPDEPGGRPAAARARDASGYRAAPHALR